VLDLDETLIHYIDVSFDIYLENGTDSYFLIRPCALEFLEELSKYYEMVIFTAGTQDVSCVNQ
jgi:CTD small phosphatase-like protein 2